MQTPHIGIVVTFLSAATMALGACTCLSGGQQQSPLSQEYRHGSHPACAVYTPAWPAEVQGP